MASFREILKDDYTLIWPKIFEALKFLACKTISKEAIISIKKEACNFKLLQVLKNQTTPLVVR